MPQYHGLPSTRSSQSLCRRKISESFWQTNGESQRPARKPFSWILSAVPRNPFGNFFASVVSQSPTAGSQPSSIWNTSPSESTPAQPERSERMHFSSIS